MGYDHTAYFRQLLERVNSAVTVQFREIEPREMEIKLNDCHPNVDRYIEKHRGSKAVRGWMFCPCTSAGRYTFIAHSVVEENDQLFDITPLDPNTPREGLVFLRHLGSEDDFSVIKISCAYVLYPPLRYEEWHESHLPVQEDTADP